MTIQYLPSPNHTPGRQGSPITDIVLHWMDGSLSSTDAEFAHGSRGVSAHYGIEDGNVHQYVADADTAWHCGDWNENCRSIGIEHSAAPGRAASTATIATSVALMVAKIREHPTISPDRIYPHQRFFSTDCPGTLPIAGMIAAVRAGVSGAPTPPVGPAPGGRSPGVVMGIQAACHIPTDGIWGPQTSHAGTVVIRRLFQPDVRYLQARVGTVVDGIWGRNSEAARVTAVRGIQASIGVAADGAWGPVSQAAWNRAYTANYQH